MLIVFSRPIDRNADFASQWHLFESLTTEPFGKIYGFEPWIMNQPRELLGSGLLIAMPARQIGLIASLFLKTNWMIDLIRWPCVFRAIVNADSGVT